MTEEEKIEEERPKLSIKEMLKVVPPPHLLKEERKKQIMEKRVRIIHSDDIKEGFIAINPRLANLLGIETHAEISVKGKRIRFEIIITDNAPEDAVMGNREELKRYGIANNSAVVVRRA